MKYSQNNEQEYILNYFGTTSGLFLDIGAYDGITFSNTYSLLKQGWSGVYLEPSEVSFKALSENLSKPEGGFNAMLLNKALSLQTGKMKFYDSGGDAVSTTSKPHAIKWQQHAKFIETEVETISVKDFTAEFEDFIFRMISLDTEGTNIELLQELPLDLWHTELIVVEHDSQYQKVIDYCSRFGMKEIHRNGENLIMGK